MKKIEKRGCCKQGPGITIYFGNKHTSTDIPSYGDISYFLGADSLTVLRQVHGTGIYHVSGPFAGLSLFEHEGDALITNIPGCALGVRTADCLPIILHDAHRNAIAVVHAGWRGSERGIAPLVLERMKKLFGTEPRDIRAYLGPAAHACCYEVQEGFGVQEEIIPRRGKLFFDNIAYNISQLISHGVPRGSIDTSSSVCTICNESHHSYRREGDKSGRQVTAAVIQNSKHSP